MKHSAVIQVCFYGCLLDAGTTALGFGLLGPHNLGVACIPGPIDNSPFVNAFVGVFGPMGPFAYLPFEVLLFLMPYAIYQIFLAPLLNYRQRQLVLFMVCFLFVFPYFGAVHNAIFIASSLARTFP